MATPDRTTSTRAPPTVDGPAGSQERGAPEAGLAAGGGAVGPEAESEEELPVVETPTSFFVSPLSSQASKGGHYQDPYPHPHVPTSSASPTPPASSRPPVPPGPGSLPAPPLQTHRSSPAVAIIKVLPYVHEDSAARSFLVETKSLRGLLLHHWGALLMALLLALILSLGVGLGVGLSCAGKFRCNSSRVCVLPSARCNAVSDCPDGEDELNCVRVSGRGSVLQVCSKGAWLTVCSTDGNSSSLGRAACRQIGYDSYSSSSSLLLSSVEHFLQQTSLVLVNLNLTALQQPIRIHHPSLLSNTRCSSGMVITLRCLECGSRPRQESRIVGGNESSPGHIPWQASLHRQHTHLCGASVITHTWVLTAAHCVYGFEDPGQWAVHVGLTAQPINGADSHAVKRILIHAQYRPRRTEHDVALLRLDTPISFNGLVEPICLPNHGEQLEEGRSCWISGWGATQDGGELSLVLRSVQVEVFSGSLCPASSSPWTLCTGPHSCQGDSGGPLACEGGAGWKLWGSGGWSYGCGGGSSAGLYTHIPHALPWIHRHMEREEAQRP